MYMAPEQIRKDYLDERTDIYSLGLTFYEMLTWRMPFIGQNEQSILQKNLAEMPLAPHKVNESVPRLLSDMIMTMIEKKPENRYPSMDKVIYDFKKFLMDAKKRTRQL
jgi:serine/threonine-protein kinase